LNKADSGGALPLSQRSRSYPAVNKQNTHNATFVVGENQNTLQG